MTAYDNGYIERHINLLAGSRHYGAPPTHIMVVSLTRASYAGSPLSREKLTSFPPRNRNRPHTLTESNRIHMHTLILQ